MVGRADPMSDAVEARAASTVVLLRDGADGLETLLLKRNKALLFAGGLWVFPGGALDREDIDAGGGDIVVASQLAAAREAFEESGLQPRLDEMVQLSHWTTPAAERKRFSTYFFAAPVAGPAEVVIDGGEIHDSLWIGVREALTRHREGELGMLPPTYVNLLALSAYAGLEQMLAEERDSAAPQVLPVLGRDGDHFFVMFRGDAGYGSGDGDSPGALHRAVFDGTRWRYLYHDVDAEFPALVPQTVIAEELATIS
jgi:8-oxo-dGTP pyrophosphatase MutT (NUDIX family)